MPLNYYQIEHSLGVRLYSQGGPHGYGPKVILE
jgi:hypothetical protein